MTTATLSKQTVEAKWNTAKLQEEFGRVMAMNMMTTMGILSKHGEELTKEFQAAMMHNKVEHYKQLGVKTPMDLVKHMAEFEANMFGSKIEIWGDEKTAHMQYNACGMWNAIKKTGKMDAQQEEKMGAQFQTCTQNLAKEFGITAEIKFEGDSCLMTFTK
ncbi:MAG TPA: hypothetical protein V6C86_11845 [Oculatellaceae cyanobacterium]